MNEKKITNSLSAEELDAVVGGGWKSKVVKGITHVGKQLGDGISDGIKSIGRWATVGGATEGVSRGAENATGGKVRIPRPTDVIQK